jgi:hypothetical protein
MGLAGARALTGVPASSLYGVSAFDPIPFAVVPALLLPVTIASCLIPARRAANIDPMRTLRYERLKWCILYGARRRYCRAVKMWQYSYTAQVVQDAEPARR